MYDLYEIIQGSIPAVPIPPVTSNAVLETAF